MSVVSDKENASHSSVMYIRGIPFQCGPGEPAPSAEEVAKAEAAKHLADAATCPSRLLAESLAGDDAAAAGPVPEGRAGFMRNRRAVRVFTNQVVPVGRLRELVYRACTDLGRRSGLAHFVMVESETAMARITGLVASWMRREGLLGDKADQELEDRMLFGGAPHIAIVHGPSGRADAAEVCDLALARLEWAAISSGLGACFAGEVFQAAARDSALFAALSVPEQHSVYGALLLGHSSFALSDPSTLNRVRMVWL